MKSKIKRLYKNINNRYPFIGALILKIYYWQVIRTISKSIYGDNNIVSYKNAILSSVSFDIRGSDNHIEISEGCILNNVKFYIRGNKHKVLINKNCKFNQGGSIWFEDSGCQLIIGEGSTFENVHLALTEPNSQIDIGDDCMFAYDIDIRTGDSHSIISQASNERINYAKNIFIGNHVWIAAHSILLKGTFISDNSVVATGSVLTKQYKTSGVIIGGNPSRVLKEEINWTRERIY